MLTDYELKEIKKELESSQKPLFIFHDDGDGVCSFLLCYRYVKRGRGELLKRVFTLTEEHSKIVKEYEPDKVFVLDIPEISQEFINNIKVPIIWIDHHPVQDKEGINYFNPRRREPEKNYPVSYLCYKALKKDMWIGMIGSVSDYYLPEFKEEFSEKYPNLISKYVKTPGEALYKTRLGEIIQSLSFFLKSPKGKIEAHLPEIINMEKPTEILELANKELVEKYEELKAQALKEEPQGKFFIYKHKGKLSFISDLANELIYRFPDKIVIVAREYQGSIKASLRSRKYKIATPLKEVLRDIEGGGGGHDLACGIKIKAKEWDKFVKKLKVKF